MTADQVKGTVTWKSFMSWRAGSDIYQILLLVLKSSKKYFWIPAVAYSADSSKYSNNFAKTKKKILLASKSEAHIEKIHEKNWGQKISRYCPFKSCQEISNLEGKFLMEVLKTQKSILISTCWRSSKKHIKKSN